LTRDWDAEAYDRLSRPQVEMALQVLDRLPLRGDEAVLDAGCGSGRVTRLLVERVPRGRVVAVDAAPSMVKLARQALPTEVDVLHADLAALTLAEHVDVVFSSAVFHWVPDHDGLFKSLFAALRPGGRLVAQCGGAGNVRRFHAAAREVAQRAPFADHFDGWVGDWNFATPEQTRARIERAGFVDANCWLEPHPVVPTHTVEYLRTVCLGHHIQQLPEELRDDYVEAAPARKPGS
jgi:trans-aconitate 2-methyltransferase